MDDNSKPKTDFFETVKQFFEDSGSDDKAWIWLLLFAMLCVGADNRQIIRCADCKYYEKRGAPGGLGWCSRPGAGCGNPEDHYCAGAQRKEDV